jgi:hypothetical protein
MQLIMTGQDGTNDDTNDILRQIKGQLTQDGIDDILGEIEDQLKRQADRKTSLEQRGITVITTSTALATVVFTVVAAITKISSIENFVKAEHFWIQVGVGSFLLAAIGGLVVNFPIPYGEIVPETISDLADWVKSNRDSTDTHLGAVERLVNNGVGDLELWQKRNSFKAQVLFFAFFWEVLAVGFLLVALVIILAKI